MNHYPMPFTRVEIAIQSLVQGQLCTLLVRRKEAPHKGFWAMPGGVVRIDLDKDLEEAAQRVTQERLGVRLPYLKQLTAVGSQTRDPRSPWALSVVYRALIPFASIEPRPGKRVEELRWLSVNEFDIDQKLAFDHQDLICSAIAATRMETDELQLPTGFLPATFTLTELQSLCEQLGGRSLDKSSFRRKLRDRQLVEPVEGEFVRGANRPALLYRLRTNHNSDKTQ